jgi:hypothetical protein
MEAASSTLMMAFSSSATTRERQTSLIVQCRRRRLRPSYISIDEVSYSTAASFGDSIGMQQYYVLLSLYLPAAAAAFLAFDG